MISGNGRLESGEDIDLARAADLKDRSTAVSHVEILFAIKSYTCGDAHAFDVNRHVSGRGDLIDNSFVAAGDVEKAVAIEGEPRGVHQIRHEGLGVVVGVDLVN